jgi:hypothetical protein
MTDRRDDDFADAAEDLSAILEDLRDELKREAPRGPFDLPRPPSPSEVIRFADEVAIPGTIAILEVNIKLLETVQRAIRVVDTGARARERAVDARDRAGDSADRLADVSDRTLRRLEDSLSDLQTALESGSLPDDGAAGELLAEARALRDDVQSRVEVARQRDHTLEDFEARADEADAQRRADAERVDDPGSVGGSGRPTADADEDDVSTGVKVDVDAELETLKDRYGKRDGERDNDDRSADEDDRSADEGGHSTDDGKDSAANGDDSSGDRAASADDDEESGADGDGDSDGDAGGVNR